MLRSERKVFLTLVVVLTACGPARPSVPGPVPIPGGISLVPAPEALTLVGGQPFTLGDSSAIVVDAPPSSAATRLGDMLALVLRPSTGFAIPLKQATGPTPHLGIRLRVDSTHRELGDEGYSLVVTGDSVLLIGRTDAGLFRGTQTVRQLFPAEIESQIGTKVASGWRIPAVNIMDRPRYQWRGGMLDVSRHFFTPREVKQFIDLLALYKFNTVHLHLADDQGWRIEIKSRPKLTSVGGASQMGGGTGGFYTQDEYSDIVRYAADRFITVIPEVEMPGHSTALITAYPEVRCTASPGATSPNTFGEKVGICPDSAESFRIIDDVVREVAALTPGPFIHIGADEVAHLTVDQFVRFVERAQEIVNKHGKRMIGWEEIFRVKLLPSTIVQLWHTDSARAALAYGSKLILSPAPKIYLDMKYSPTTELGLAWSGYVDVRTSYDWDPATYLPGATGAEIGIEAPLWTETVRNITAAEYMVMPRLPAVAEVAWSPQSARRWDDFRVRLAAQAPRWRILGINYYPSAQVPWPSP